MTDILFIIIAVAVVIVVFFLVPLIIEARKTMISLRKTTEEYLNPALTELQLTSRNLRDICDNVTDITDDVKRFSHAVSDVGRTIGTVRGLVDGVGTSASIRAISLRVGVKTALQYLFSNILKKGDTR